MNQQNHELTQTEKHQIESLVKSYCANYDPDYGCLPLECECYMLGVCHTDSPLCKYFRDVVLPIEPKLEAVFHSSG